jgi:hypothetical protein
MNEILGFELGGTVNVDWLYTTGVFSMGELVRRVDSCG